VGKKIDLMIFFITNQETLTYEITILTLVLEREKQGKAELIMTGNLFWESGWPRKP